MYRVLDICSGIGGFTLGALISGGFKTVAFCEIEPFCQQLLNKRFPNIPIIKDVRNITTELISDYGLGQIDGITAGFPCQPFSMLGNRKGKEDPRFLWNEITRVIRLLQPQWCVFENVSGLLSIDEGNVFKTILWELSELGFNVEWQLVSASSLGATHQRKRIWIIAYTSSKSRYKKMEVDKREKPSTPTSEGAELTGEYKKLPTQQVGIEYEFCRSYDGISAELDRYLLRKSGYKEWITASAVPSPYRYFKAEIENYKIEHPEVVKDCSNSVNEYNKLQNSRMKSLGNAIVPQVAAKVFDRLKELINT